MSAGQLQNPLQKLEKTAISERIQNFPPGALFRYKDQPDFEYRIIGYNTLGEHIIFVPKDITTLEDMNGNFDITWIMDDDIERVD